MCHVRARFASGEKQWDAYWHPSPNGTPGLPTKVTPTPPKSVTSRSVSGKLLDIDKDTARSHAPRCGRGTRGSPEGVPILGRWLGPDVRRACRPPPPRICQKRSPARRMATAAATGMRGFQAHRLSFPSGCQEPRNGISQRAGREWFPTLSPRPPVRADFVARSIPLSRNRIWITPRSSPFRVSVRRPPKAVCASRTALAAIPPSRFACRVLSPRCRPHRAVPFEFRLGAGAGHLAGRGAIPTWRTADPGKRKPR